jgi:hypothetical protein
MMMSSRQTSCCTTSTYVAAAKTENMSLFANFRQDVANLYNLLFFFMEMKVRGHADIRRPNLSAHDEKEGVLIVNERK